VVPEAVIYFCSRSSGPGFSSLLSNLKNKINMITNYIFSRLIFSIILIVLFPLFAFSSSGDDSALSGRVLFNNEGVPFVTVHIKGTPAGSSTDADGRFTLPGIPAGIHTVRAQGVGFKSAESVVEVAAGQTLEIILVLEQDFLLMEQVIVSGRRIGLLRYLPGSAGMVTGPELKAIAPLTGNEVLRSVTGIHVVEEEGAGLRANIGIRGLDPDKSRNVLILEDGIPVALGPYGEPEMYFTPSIDRMDGIEILKGSGSILYGPQTVGGVINYITADPPAESTGFARFSGGQGGYYTGQFGYGDTYGSTGFTVNYLRRQAENLGTTEFNLNDINTKLRFKPSQRSDIMMKLGIYDENSNSTYVGITQYMFDAGSYDFSRLAPDDNLSVRRYSIGLNHNFIANDRLRFNTTAFAYTTTRNWKRQDFTTDPEASNLTGVMWGNDVIPGGAVFLRNSTGNRNRQFEVAGIEPRFNFRYSLAGRQNILDTGTRLMYERAYEQRIDGSTATAISGALRDDEIRTGYAFSTWAQNKLMVNDKLSFTAGLRTEMLDYERHILRSSSKDVDISNKSSLAEIIPGMGVNYNFSAQTGLFAGVHRGFAPPRIKDAISNSGTDMQLDAEKSWNYEVGTRTGLFNVADFEMTLFVMDFSNQVIPVSESSGGAGTGYINGGRTMHRGAEAEIVLRISELTGMAGNMTMGLNSTLTRSVFSSDRYVVQCTHDVDEKTFVNVKGNYTPYAPGLLASGFLQYEKEEGYGLRISGNFTGRQYTDVLNTGSVSYWFAKAENNPNHNYFQATADGRIGMLPSFFVMNATAWYNLSSGINLSLMVKNMFNERYIASRRPQGIRVGLPRMINAGISYHF
jgi:Fe(3+) dicitrate transport protein